MELFLLFPELSSKNFFYKMFLNFANKFKTGFPLHFEPFEHFEHYEHF